MNDGERTAPVLVLGLGNLLLQDDAVGLELLAALSQRHLHDPRIDFVDGGTQGIALTALLGSRASVLILDAVQQGAAPGTIHRIDHAESRPPRGNAGAIGGAHELNAGDLLLAARLLGELPRTAVVGIEPAIVRTGIGLSPAVQDALPAAVALADEVLCDLLAQGVARCTN